MATKRPDEGRKDVVLVQPSKLIFDPDFNPRERMGDMKGLKNEIRAQGVKDPLTGYRKGDKIVVKSGHRRTIVCQELEKEGVEIWVPVLLEPQNYNVEQRVLDLWTDNGGLAFTPWEQAKILKRLLNFNWSEEKILKESGKSKTYIHRLKLLLAAPQKAIDLIHQGRATATQVMDLIADGKIQDLLKKAAENQLVAQQPELDMFQQSEEVVVQQPKPERIKPSDLSRPVSFKKVGKWMSSIDKKALAPDKRKSFELWDDWINGRLTQERFNKHFS